MLGVVAPMAVELMPVEVKDIALVDDGSVELLEEKTKLRCP